MNEKTVGVNVVQSSVRIHAPRIVHVISSVYRTVYAAVMEAIQNAIDSGAKKVEITINLTASLGDKRSIIVCDNGKGMSREEFSQTMGRVGLSYKQNDADSLGRHGIGLMSFLGKAGKYSFTTGPKADKGTATWEGYTQHNLGNMLNCNDELAVIGTPLLEDSKHPQWWNTQVNASDFRGARLTISLQALQEGIIGDFNVAMTRYGTEVTINFTDSRGKKSVVVLGPRQFTGNRFKQHHPRGEYAGLVTFEMYRLASPTGVVLLKISSDAFTRDWRNLRELALSSGMNRDLCEALTSGYFEGVITISNGEWSYDRKSLKPENENVWFDIILLVEEWMRSSDVQSFMDEVLGKKEEKREFELLHRLLKYFAGLDKSVLYDALLNLPAAVSAGHTPLPDGKPGNKGRTIVPRPRGKVVRTETTTQSGSTRDKTGERRSQTHFSVEQDRNGNARFVSGSQVGLSFGLRSLGIGYYEWDLAHGVLVINREHPYYQSIKDSDIKVMAYFTGIAEWAITLLTYGDQDTTHPGLQEMERQYMRFLAARISSS